MSSSHRREQRNSRQINPLPRCSFTHAPLSTLYCVTAEGKLRGTGTSRSFCRTANALTGLRTSLRCAVHGEVKRQKTNPTPLFTPAERFSFCEALRVSLSSVLPLFFRENMPGLLRDPILRTNRSLRTLLCFNLLYIYFLLFNFFSL